MGLQPSASECQLLAPQPHFQGVVHIPNTEGNLVDEVGHVDVGGADGTRRTVISASANISSTDRGNTSYGIVESHPQRKCPGLFLVNVALLRVTIMIE